MIYPIRITKAARRDLEEIYLWIAEHDSPEKAGYVLDRLSEVSRALLLFLIAAQDRKSCPLELERTTVRSFSSPIA
jgi:plasmid stabilization system protein ParE